MTQPLPGSSAGPAVEDAREGAKRAAAEAAVDRFVRSGMTLGLGTGSTAVWAVRRIGALLATGELRDVAGVPTSELTAQHATEAGVPLTSLDLHPHLAVTIDGADEVSPALDLVKGGGGAHLREKIIAQASEQLVIVVDEPKLVPAIGSTRGIPIEVVRMALRTEREFLESLGATVTERRAPDGSAPFVTDQGNRILDAFFGPIADPAGLVRTLEARAGIMAIGLFVGFNPVVLVASADGVRELSRDS
jgi:ribose 5-phosphate isomerase A